MICIGHTNSCTTHSGYDPPLDPVSWTNDPVSGSVDEIKASHYNELTFYINQEFSRRGLSPSAGFPPTDKETDDIIYGDDYRLILKDHVLYLSKISPSGTWSPPPTAVGHGIMARGQWIKAVTTQLMRDEMDTIRGECLCDCNYACTCNCNYCVCDCNFT